MLKKLLIGLGVVVVLLIAAVFIVPALIPMETYKDELTARVKSATGRDLTINGDVSLSLFPTLGIEVGEVVFSNAEGAAQPQMVSLTGMTVALKLMPLISSRIEVEKFILLNPVINLEVDEAGRPNWDFAGMAAQAEAGAAAGTTEAAQAQAQADGGFGIEGISLGEVRLENGTVRYSDRRSGEEMVISKINMDLDLPGLDAPMVASGRATWNGEEVSLTLRIESPANAMAGATTPLSISVDSSPVKLAFDGSVTNGQTAAAGGTVDLDVPSVRALAAWAGSPLAFEGDGFGPLSIKGTLALDGQKISFSGAEIGFDAIEGKGEVAFDGGGVVPYIMAKLAVDRLDLNPYLPPPPPESEAATGDAATSGSSGGGGEAQAGTWSDEPIDASALGTVNADLAFSSGEILMQNIKIDGGAVAVKLRDGKLNVDLTDLKLYGGQGGAQVTIDASGGALAIANKIEVSGIQARPMLDDASGMDWLEGTGGFALDVSGRGASQKEIVSSLGGNGSFKFLDGALYGFNIAEIMRQVGSGDITAVFDPDSLGEGQKTDFAELSGTYVIQNGVVRNDDLKMLSPLLRVTGAGTAAMPPRTIDYRIEPKLVGSLEGQGGQGDMKGLTVPMLIKGPWHDYDIEPDLAAMLASNPEALLQGLTAGGLTLPGLPALGGGTGTTDPAAAVESVIEGVLSGGDSSQPSSGEQPAEPANPVDAIKSLFD